MPKKLMTKDIFGFKYERKRIKREKKLTIICPDYDANHIGSCKKAKLCKNATYGREGAPDGVCYGGAKEDELVHRKKYFVGNKS